MAVVIVLFGPSIGYIAIAGYGRLADCYRLPDLQAEQVKMVWKTGPVQQLVMGITFVFSLLIPLQYAVLIGVAMSLLMFVIQQSNKITIKQWKQTEGPYPIEQDPPETVPANEAMLLVPYGSLFFAAAPPVRETVTGSF